MDMGARAHPVGRPPSRLSLDAYVRYRLGRTWREQLRNLLSRPLGASSFAGFWRYWNPVYGYVLLRYAYGPLRRWLPRPVAAWLTFGLCGFVLHDAVGWALAQRVRAPEMTLLFAVWGGEAVIGEALGLDLASRPYAVRASVNVAQLALGWWIVSRVVLPLVERTGVFPA
jgi:hypothetical protein